MPLVSDRLTKIGFAGVAAFVLSGACSSGDDKPFGWQVHSRAGTSGAFGTSDGRGGDSPEGGGSNAAGEGNGASSNDAGVPGSGGTLATGAQGGTGGGGARAGQGGTGALAGGAGKSSTSTVGVAKLERIVTGAPWEVGQQTTGIAVDHDGRVYVNDETAVYRVTGTKVEKFLTAAEIEADLTIDAQVPHLDDLDITPDDQLYVMASGILVATSAPHTFQLLLDMRVYTDFYEPSHLGVVTGGYAAVVKNDGLWHVASATENVYAPEALHWSSGCACEDLAVAQTGTFLYQPGCNGSPLIRGDVNGGDVGVLYDSVFNKDNPLEAQNFLCVARDPAGGFYVVVDNDLNHTELYHLDENADDGTGVRRIETKPTLQSERETEDSPFAMRYCSIAVDPVSGSVNLVTFADLWRISWD
jgi:hypothetical protein